MPETNAILDVFNFSVEDLGKPETNNYSNMYSPDPKKGKAGVYDTIIRFLPNHMNVQESIIKKYFFWLEDPQTKQGFYADCPTNIGEKSFLYDLYWKFKNSESVTEQAKADKFKRKDNYYSLIQIVKDDNKPELNGKIMIFKYGYKLHQMIESIKKPKFGNPKNPFDLFSAPLFGLSVKTLHGWNNYDDSKFIEGTEGPIRINGKLMNKDSAEDRQTIMDYLKTSPDLSSTKHQAWDDKKTEEIMRIVRFYTNSENTTTQTSQATPAPTNSVPVSTPTSAPVNTPVSTPVASVPVASVPVSAPVETITEQLTADSSNDPLAALYANL